MRTPKEILHAIRTLQQVAAGATALTVDEDQRHNMIVSHASLCWALDYPGQNLFGEQITMLYRQLEVQHFLIGHR